jgi:di/tricarboxylate transporter
MRNNGLAMLGTIAAIGILAWWIGFFDPTTCTPSNQQQGWTSCEAIANERNIALWLLIGITVAACAAWIFRKRK